MRFEGGRAVEIDADENAEALRAKRRRRTRARRGSASSRSSTARGGSGRSGPSSTTRSSTRTRRATSRSATPIAFSVEEEDRGRLNHSGDPHRLHDRLARARGDRRDRRRRARARAARAATGRSESRRFGAVPCPIIAPAHGDLELHGIDAGGRCAGTCGAVLITEARSPGRGRARRGRRARRRHRQAHGPLRRRQVRRPRARVRGADLVGQGQQAARAGAASSGLRAKVVAYLGERDLYVVDAYAGADPAHRMARARRHAERRTTRSSRGRCSSAPSDGELDGLRAGRASSCTRPALEADPEEDGTRTGTFIALHPTRRRGPDRRHVLRRRDQEVDLHADERPAAARGRLPDALLGERRRRGRRGDLLRALRHRQDDPLGRSRAAPDRRRRARLGRLAASSTSRAAATPR